jgi:hypothetical protein
MFYTVDMVSLIVMIAVFAALAVLALRFGADSRRDGFTL